MHPYMTEQLVRDRRATLDAEAAVDGSPGGSRPGLGPSICRRVTLTARAFARRVRGLVAGSARRRASISDPRRRARGREPPPPSAGTPVSGSNGNSTRGSNAAMAGGAGVGACRGWREGRPGAGSAEAAVPGASTNAAAWPPSARAASRTTGCLHGPGTTDLLEQFFAALAAGRARYQRDLDQFVAPAERFQWYANGVSPAVRADDQARDRASLLGYLQRRQGR